MDDMNLPQLVTKKDDAGALMVAGGSAAVPSLVMAAGGKAGYRFLEFFAANIRNRNTREAYYRACCAFFHFAQARGAHELDAIRSHHVAAYIEQLCSEKAA